MVVLGSSFLEPGLVKAGIVKRVDSVENADLCYWDAQARTFGRVQIQTQIPSLHSRCWPGRRSLGPLVGGDLEMLDFSKCFHDLADFGVGLRCS